MNASLRLTDVFPALLPALCAILLGCTALPSVAADPVAPPAAPTLPATDVVSLYTSSGTYSDAAVDTWRTDWSQGNFEDYAIGGTGPVLKKYSTLNYAGVEFFNPKVDAGAMTMLHLSVWTPDATKFSVKLVSFAPGAAEREIFFDNTVIVQDQWISLNIPLSQFAGVDITQLGQLLFINNAGGVENGTFYIDNVYFWDDGSIAPPPPAPATAAPQPTAPDLVVKSLYNSSATYVDEFVDTWRASWSQGNVNDYTIEGTSSVVKKYSSLNYAGVEFLSAPLDVTAQTTLHLDLWTPDATKFSLKLVSFAPDAAEREIFFDNTVIVQNQWVSLDIPLSQFTGVEMTSLGQLLFINNAGGVEFGTFYIDNVYFYNDGTPPPPVIAPAAAAPAPTIPAANVISLYTSSFTYVDEFVDTWRAAWSVGNLADYTIEGTTGTVKKYSALNYAGVEFLNPEIDASAMTTLHLDLWTPDATKFSVKLVSFAPDAAEREIFFDDSVIVQKQWVSLEIPLSQFSGVDMSNLGQLLFINNAGGVEFGTFYIDNVYFSSNGTPPPPPLVPPTAAPVPVHPAADVISLFTSSFIYSDVPVDTWRAGWSVGNLSDYTIAGTANPVKKYASLNYAGVEFFNPKVDASTMSTLHLDLWTPDATKFSVKLVSFNPDAAEKEVFFDNTAIVQNQWVSLDIPLSQFTGVDLTSLAQLLFINNAGGVELGTFYIDNVYFSRPGSAALSLTAAPGSVVSWPAVATATYQPQRSADGSSWTDFAGSFPGTGPASAFDELGLAFHRVLMTPAGGSATPATASSQPGIRLSWPTQAGTTYQVQTGSSLSGWAPAGAALTGSGSQATWFEAISTPARFYRVVIP